MATLTLELPEPVLKRIEVAARNHGHTIEEESIELLLNAVSSDSDDFDFIPKERLQEAADAHRRAMAAQGICIPIDEITAAIKEARR